MAKIDRSNLGFLGEEFQYKLIKTFMDEPKFFKDIYLIVDQNMFTDANLRDYVGVMKEYYNKYELVPSYSMMEICLNDKAKTEIQQEFYRDVIKKLKSTTSEGIEEIREKSEKFFKQQNMIKVAHEIIKIAGDGDLEEYEKCAQLVQDIVTVGAEEDMGSGVYDNMDEVLSDDYRITIPSGVGKIDDTLEGGLAKGELGVIIGPSSFGKSSLTTAMASYAATHRCEHNDNNGFKVLQIIFEDRVKQIQRKHMGRLTNVEARNLSKPENIESVRETLENFPDKEMLIENLRIKRFPTGEISPSKIRLFIKALINTGFRPDLVIIDYFECLIPDKDNNLPGYNEWSLEGKTMRKLETLAEEFNIGLWVPTQGGRDSIGAEIVTLSQSGGSIKKIQIGHVVLSIARSMEQIEQNKANIAILKNRAGQAGKIIMNANFNNGTCRIDTDKEIVFDSVMSFKKEEQAQRIDEIVNQSREVFQSQQKK